MTCSDPRQPAGTACSTHTSHTYGARIDEGVTATSVLLEEITARGYRGGQRTLRRWLVAARQHLDRPLTPPPVPASRTITGWLMRPATTSTSTTPRPSKTPASAARISPAT